MIDTHCHIDFEDFEIFDLNQDVIEVKDGVSLYRNPVQTMDQLANIKAKPSGLRSFITLIPSPSVIIL